MLPRSPARRLLAPLLAGALLVGAACSSDGGDDGATTSTTGSLTFAGGDEVSTVDTAAVDTFVRWARDPGLSVPGFAPSVTLVWGHDREQEFVVVSPADRASWTAPALGFEGHEGPIEVLQLIADAGDLEYSADDHPHCTELERPLVGLEGRTVINVQPVRADDDADCDDWFALDLVFDDAHRIEQVILDLWQA